MTDINSHNLKNDFLKKYKHNYINHKLYEQAIDLTQVYYFRLLLSPDHSKNELLYDALINMQTSLNLHDLITSDESETSDDDLDQNQLLALVGDYHSSLFYKLLADSRQTEQLYHFLSTVQEINQLKMGLLKDDTSPTNLLHKLEKVHSLLFKRIVVDYMDDEKRDQLNKQYLYDFMYNNKSFKDLAGNHIAFTNELNVTFENRKNELQNQISTYSQVNRRACE
ncbi:heptaprenyl diphosphate synthase component 1 [Halalkalibacillus halophilus]|uniref:heptaprenyl diphosphate synthase component 1 n=1 Tax=Halalkalibacillus halophilus TaxID=392827 RepID=UPI0003FD6DF1|nr:heptaprenyl diphosphate synthase component 1 [Halalkalibacillus halophilus]